MASVNTEGLPPEMQQRIAQIIEGAKQKAAQQPKQADQQTAPEQPAPQPEAPRQPSLMEHAVALRQEVAVARQEIAALRQENQVLAQQLTANSQVVDAVGNAVGQLYQMFCAQTEVTNYGAAPQTAAPIAPEVSDF